MNTSNLATGAAPGSNDDQAANKDAFSPAYESGEDYGGQGTGEDADYEDGNNTIAVGQPS